jgi:hypothetical protein
VEGTCSSLLAPSDALDVPFLSLFKSKSVK